MFTNTRIPRAAALCLLVQGMAVMSGCTTVRNADGSHMVRLTVPNMASLLPLPVMAAPAANSKPAASAAVATTVSATPVGKTVLAGIFSKHPYDGTAKTTYPRVALTVTDWSRSDCWLSDAVIWWSGSKSQKVSNFSVCMSHSLGGAVNGAAGLHMFMGQTQVFNNSGNVRTSGPRAPLMAIPKDSPADFTEYIRQMIVETGWEGGVPETNFWLVGFKRRGG